MLKLYKVSLVLSSSDIDIVVLKFKVVTDDKGWLLVSPSEVNILSS